MEMNHKTIFANNSRKEHPLRERQRQHRINKCHVQSYKAALSGVVLCCRDYLPPRPHAKSIALGEHDDQKTQWKCVHEDSGGGGRSEVLTCFIV